MRNGAIEWWQGWDLAGNVGAYYAMPVSQSEFGIPANWDFDSVDEYVIAL